MKQNYNLLTRSTAFKLAWNNFFQKSKTKTASLLVVLFTLFGLSDAFGQIAQRGGAENATANTVTTLTINKPTGVVTGDIMIVNIACDDNNTINNATLAGWTLIDASNMGGMSTQRRVNILYKIATAAEPANYTFTLGASTGNINSAVGAIIAFSGIDTSTPFDVTPGTLRNENSNSPIANTINTITNNSAIIMLGGAAGNRTWDNALWTTTSPGSLTELYDVQNVFSIGAAWSIQGTAGATGNGQARLSGNERNASILLALRPFIPPPANDTCSGAISITSNTTCSTTTGSTLGATDNNETGDCTIGGTQEAVWYSFVAVASTHVITVDGANGTDPVLGVISACGSATIPTGGACIDATGDGGIETRTLTGLTIGNTYYIQIYDYWGVNANNAFTICVTHTSPPPTITSLGAASGCVGSSLVINGTNLSGATAVTIGGTAATITGNTATTVTVTVGTGTTGTVQVTTPGGSATSVATFTVNPLPAAIGGGSATVCTGATTPAFTNATPLGTWTTSNANATIDGLGVLTGVTAGTVRVIYTLPTGCFVQTALITVQQTPGAIAGGAATVCVGASTPAFTNSNTGGTWSVVSGLGSATITAGGVLTGTSAGTVTVNYTIGTCTTATFGVTVNAVPVITTQPVVASICTTSSGTFSVVATGATTYQWRRNGVALTNTAPYSGVTTATLTITNPAVGDAGNFDVIVGNGTCSVTSTVRALTVSTVPATVGTPTPANAATGVCYAGGGAVTSISWGAAAGATSYDVYFGSGSIPGTVTSNVAATTYNTGALLANTTYFWRVVAKNACGDAVTSATFTFTTEAVACYCNSTYTNGPGTIDGITNVTLLTLNNTSGANNVAPYYTFYNAATIPNLQRTATPNISITYGSDGNQWGAVWIDFNQNGLFEAAEGFVSTVNAGANGTSVIAITVPVGAVLGNTRMRVRGGNDSALTTAQACGASSSGFGETEDYIVNIIDILPCVAPTAQPTALLLTPSSTSISGFFTVAIPSPDNYLVVISTSSTPPSPTNGTSYAIGSTVGAGYTVVDNDSNTSFNATGLTASTSYYVYIYAFNSLCTGGPLYNLVTPLTGNTTTTATSPTYCSPTTSTTTSGLYISSVAFQGTLNDTYNTSTFATAAPLGYQNFTGLSNIAVQAQGEGINIVARASGTILSRGTWKAWVDWNNDGTFTPATEEVYNIQGFAGAESTFGFVIPAATLPGNYRIRIRVNNGANPSETFGYNFTPCDNFGNGGGINNYGEAEDYVFTVIANCNANIATLTDGEVCGSGAITLGVTGTASATSYHWYANEIGGLPLATTATGSWTTPVLTTTTIYWVTASNGSCESVRRTAITAKVKPIPSITFSPISPEICGENAIVTVTTTGDNEVVHLIDETFETGTLGVFTNINNDANGAIVDAATTWQTHTSVYVPNTNVWFPAVSSGFGTNQFALAYSDSKSPNFPTKTVENSITLTNSVNSNTFINLTLKLKLFYSRYFTDGQIVPGNDEFVNIELSTDGGLTYPIVINSFTNDVGIGTNFIDLQYDLSAYINQPNLKIRIRHRSYAGTGWLPDGVGVDDIELFGEKTLNTSFNYDTSTVDAFTDFAATIPYTTGSPVSTIYIRPTLAQLANASFIIPVTANLSNACSVGGTVTVINKTKLWQPLSSDWSDGLNWQPNGVPTIDNCVIIPAVNTIPGSGINGFAKNLTVKSTGNLTIQPTNTLTVKEWVTVDTGGLFTIENSGSLIQIDNVANTGVINMKRNAVTNSPFDYVYWSTPVAGFSLNNVSPSSTVRYLWNPTTVTGYASNFGNWAAAAGGMTTGKGYIIRGSSGVTNFIGNPNNGTITTPINRSTYTGGTYTGPTSTLVTANDDNWNLLGNPYPSALSADAFLAANSANLSQFVKIWTHGIDPSAAIANPFYQNYSLNYSTSDYITYNALGGTQFSFDGKIGAGQGFFVLMNDANSTSENAVFTNTMRSNTHRNDQFYRSSATEKHRIWLTIASPTNASISTLVGYTTDATNNLDNAFDAIAQGVKTNFEIYSIAENKELIIQGRSLPFDENDQVVLGVAIPQNGIYTIAISNVDGLFSNTTQAIYLEDKQLGIFHDLRTAPYTFTGTTGRNETRFVLRYTNSTLGNEDFITNAVTVYTNESITINATNQIIKSVRVYDLLGRVLGNFSNINANTFATSNVAKTQSPLLVEVTLENGATKTYKVIF